MIMLFIFLLLSIAFLIITLLYNVENSPVYIVAYKMDNEDKDEFVTAYEDGIIDRTLKIKWMYRLITKDYKFQIRRAKKDGVE